MNPFRMRGVVEGAFFTDRAAEVARIAEALRTPGGRLLVYGVRRMGKTSAIHAAVRRVERASGRVVQADLSTTSTPVDAANRLLAGAARALGRRWRDVAGEFAARIGVRLTLEADATGLLLPSLELGLRRAPADEQRSALGRTLDGIDALAAERKKPLAVVLDEFQEIQRFGGEAAEWTLRGHVQRHGNLAYVFAGSQLHWIRRMLEQDRAFYGMFDVLRLGPIDADHLARWIDERLAGAGVRARGVGARVLELAGPRTQDIVQLARRTYDVAVSAGVAKAADIDRAYAEIVSDESDLARARWEGLSPLQQNVLRAVAASADGLTTGVTIERFGLGSTGSATNAARALVDAGLLVRGRGGTGYAFDSPFFRGWVVERTLPDIGLSRDVTHIASVPADE